MKNQTQNIFRVGTLSLAFYLLFSLTPAGNLRADLPLRIDSAKQLFVDDYAVSELNGVSRLFNQAEKHIKNPIMRAEKPWEGSMIYVGTVLYDDEATIFKMWYWVLNMKYQVPPKPFSQYENLLKAANYEESFSLCYATSSDGINWERPNLGLVEFQGSKDNNLLPPVNDGKMHNYAGIIKDDRDPDPARRYKAVAWRPATPNRSGSPHPLDIGLVNADAAPKAKSNRSGNPHPLGPDFGVGVYFSPDGLHWTSYSGNPVIRGTSDVHTLLGWDDRIGEYVAYFRPGAAQKMSPPAGKGFARIIGYSTSKNFEEWTPIIPALVPDKLDPVDTQFYGMPVMKHEGFYFGFPWVFRTNLLTHVPHFAYSRDGIHFNRTPLRNDFLPLGANGSFDDGNAWMVGPVKHDGKLWFYYTGTRWRGANDLFDLGDEVRDSIGLAILPLDGFVSIEAGPNVGTLTTRALIFSGKDLIVNMEESRKGYGTDDLTSLRVEILDESDKPISGFELERSVTMTSTNLGQAVTWKGAPLLGDLAGKVVKLRFHMRNVKIYAFQFL